MKLVNEIYDSFTREIVREKDRQASYYNKGKREYTYQVGQQVW